MKNAEAAAAFKQSKIVSEKDNHYCKSIGGAYEKPANASSASRTLADNTEVECEHPTDDVTGSLVNSGSMWRRSITLCCGEKEFLLVKRIMTKMSVKRKQIKVTVWDCNLKAQTANTTACH